MENLADIGLIGLAVMGENLVLNMESHGYTVAVYNRTVEKVDNFTGGRGAGKNFIAAHSIEELVKSLKRPRKVMMLVKAGKAVDSLIEQLIPHLEPGDIIIDGGNTHYPDTNRRTAHLWKNTWWKVLLTAVGRMEQSGSILLYLMCLRQLLM